MENEFTAIACNLVNHFPAPFPVLIVIGYIFGSIPFGLILCKFFGKGDIRKIGSGNIGATNVLRSGSKTLAAATLLLDAAKPLAAYLFSVTVFYGNIFELNKPCALAGHSIYNPFVFSPVNTIWPLPDFLMPIVLGAVLGHCFPIWLKFTLAGVAACVVWLTSAFIFKISSLAALIALLITPIITFVFYGPWPAILCGFSVAIIFWRHKENIQRILKGEEPKIGQKDKQ